MERDVPGPVHIRPGLWDPVPGVEPPPRQAAQELASRSPWGDAAGPERGFGVCPALHISLVSRIKGCLPRCKLELDVPPISHQGVFHIAGRKPLVGCKINLVMYSQHFKTTD